MAKLAKFNTVINSADFFEIKHAITVLTARVEVIKKVHGEGISPEVIQGQLEIALRELKELARLTNEGPVWKQVDV